MVQPPLSSRPAEAAPSRVVVAEDSPVLRDGIAHLLTEAGFDVVASCGDSDGLLGCVEALQPDLVIVDLRLPPTGTDEGLRAAKEIRSRWPLVGVLVLTPYAEVGLAEQLLDGGQGRVGFLLQERVADPDAFTVAARRVAGGGWALDPLVVDQLLARGDRDGQLGGLTGEERRLLSMLVEGRGWHERGGPLFAKLGLGSATTDEQCGLAVLGWLRGVNDCPSGRRPR